MYHRATLIILLLLVFLALRSNWIIYEKKRASDELKESSQARVDELKNRANEIEAKIEHLSTPSGVEDEIRSKFNVAKEGENIVIVLEDDSLDASSTQSKIGFWTKIWHFFGK